MNKTKLYVSFDVFDTLVTRLLSPEKMFEIVEKKLMEEGCLFAKGFMRKRILAEKRLTETCKKPFSIHDIYNQKEFEDIEEFNKNLFIEEEKKIEITSCVKNETGYRMYIEMMKKSHIICISDMYFSREVIEKILNNNGYFPEKLYVSSDLKKSKKNKDLFDYVIKDLQIEKNELFHIGDALRSDWLNPKLIGIKSCLFRDNTAGDIYLKKIGRTILGPLMFEFLSWIDTISHDGKLIFLTREGDTFAKFYKIIFDREVSIFCTSRKAILKGICYDALKSNKMLEVLQLIDLGKSETIEKFCTRIGINVDNHIEEFKDSEIDLTEKFNVTFLRYLYDNRESYLPEMEMNKEALKIYIESVFDSTKKNYLVDLGWKGRMQNCMSFFLNINELNYDIEGLYLGVMEQINKKGFLFNNDNKMAQNILCFSGLLEILFMPKYGSVLGYTIESKEVVPKLDVSEFTELDYLIIQSVQDGIQEYLFRFKNYTRILVDDKRSYLHKLLKLGLFPSKRDIKTFQKLWFYDNGQKKPLIEDISLQDRMNGRRILNMFVESKWKTAYCRKLFGIRLPYNIFINFLRKKVKNDEYLGNMQKNTRV